MVAVWLDCVAKFAGSFGPTERPRTAGASKQKFVPLVVFFSLRHHIVRGLLAGSVKKEVRPRLHAEVVSSPP